MVVDPPSSLDKRFQYLLHKTRDFGVGKLDDLCALGALQAKACREKTSARQELSHGQCHFHVILPDHSEYPKKTAAVLQKKSMAVQLGFQRQKSIHGLLGIQSGHNPRVGVGAWRGASPFFGGHFRELFSGMSTVLVVGSPNEFFHPLRRWTWAKTWADLARFDSAGWARFQKGLSALTVWEPG